jgi:hypothetical protein
MCNRCARDFSFWLELKCVSGHLRAYFSTGNSTHLRLYGFIYVPLPIVARVATSKERSYAKKVLEDSRRDFDTSEILSYLTDLKCLATVCPSWNLSSVHFISAVFLDFSVIVLRIRNNCCKIILQR